MSAKVKYGILIGLIVIAFAITGFFIFINLNSSGKLAIHVAPQNATVIVNNNTYDNNNEYTLPAGNYSGVIKRENFEEQPIDFTITKNETTIISGYLVPISHDYSIYESSYDDMYFLIEYASLHPEETELVQYTKNYLDKIESMANLLPIYYTSPEDWHYTYIISDGSKESDCPIFCIHIEATNPYMYEKAIDKLKEISKYPLDNYLILKKILTYPLRQPDPEL